MCLVTTPKQLLEIYGVLMIYGISSVTCETKQGLAAVMLCMQPRGTRQNYKRAQPQLKKKKNETGHLSCLKQN